jgi:hypothetical protein
MLLAMLAGCSSDRGAPAPTRPRNSPPVVLTVPPSTTTLACFADLSRQNVRHSPLPDRDYGDGCTVVGAVQLIDYGVPTTNLTAMACPLARTFVAWARNGIAPAAREILGSELVRIDTFGSYACRNTVGTTTVRLSQHATASAVDVSAFVLRDGRRITIEHDWNSEDEAVREFLRVIRRSACRRFPTVLGPDYNAAHDNHFHLDLAGRSLCR